jgi:pteridine reductase
VKRLIESVLARFGRIDLLANCAAIWEPKPLEDITADDVRRHFEVNALGTFLCSQHAGLAMVKQPEGGLIVTVGDWAETRPNPGYAAYFPSKGAVTAMTRSLAVELGMRNPRVRVNCVLPGPVMLPPELSEAEKKEAIDATLVKREGSPRQVKCGTKSATSPNGFSRSRARRQGSRVIWPRNMTIISTVSRSDDDPVRRYLLLPGPVEPP